MSKYKDETTELARLFKALSNPSRLKIFFQLRDCCAPGEGCAVEAPGKSCVGDIGALLGIAPSTLSHHLKEMASSGLVRLERRGQYVDCSLDPDTFNRLREFFARAPFQDKTGDSDEREAG